MDINEIIKDINYICLLIAIFIFLIIKFLKYLISRERLKIKRSESSQNSNNSLFHSIGSGSPHSI